MGKDVDHGVHAGDVIGGDPVGVDVSAAGEGGHMSSKAEITSPSHANSGKWPADVYTVY